MGHHQVQGAADLDFYLYLHSTLILDVYRRYVVGWLVAERESAILADHLITKTCRKQDITPEKLTLHADRGSAMTSKKVALLLADLDNKLNKKVIHPTT